MKRVKLGDSGDLGWGTLPQLLISGSGNHCVKYPGGGTQDEDSPAPQVSGGAARWEALISQPTMASCSGGSRADRGAPPREGADSRRGRWTC